MTGRAIEAPEGCAVGIVNVCAQVLEEFYENLQNVGVSAATGEGMDAFFKKVQACAEEYRQLYLPELRKRQKVCGTCASGISALRSPGGTMANMHCVRHQFP